MESKHGDFWGHVLAFINDAYDECFRMVQEGKLDQFEKIWLDPENGKIAFKRLEELPWFADAKPRVKEFALKSIRFEVEKMVDYFHFAAELLNSNQPTSP